MQRFMDKPISTFTVSLKVAGALAMLYGFGRILIAAEPAGIAIGLGGAVMFQIATLLAEQSLPVRLLSRTPVSALMTVECISVPSWWSVAKVKSQYPGGDGHMLFALVQDGYMSAFALSDDLDSLRDDQARNTSIAQVARPIEYVHAVRSGDSTLDALSIMRRFRKAWLPVTDNRDTLGGVVTLDAINRLLQSELEPCTVLHVGQNRPAAASARQVEPDHKVAA